ncbi:MAG: TetR/AcrR family transcriptional regulator [Nocardioidaceae bacterium]
MPMPVHTAADKACSRPRIEGDRETEILDATLSLLAQHGYDRLTMDAVATAAKASKATLYRRWTSKADLVIDALIRGTDAPHVDAPDTGSLRSDLLAVACHQGGLNDPRALAVLAAVITAIGCDEEFSDAFHTQFLQPKADLSRTIYARAKARGEIAQDVDLDLLAPVLAAIVLHRAFILRSPIDDHTVGRIIDEIVMPAATRNVSQRTTRPKGQ